MKLKLLAFALIGSFALQSCGKEEEKKPIKKPVTKKVVEDEFESLEDLLASQDTVTLIEKKNTKPSSKKVNSAVENIGIPTPGESGRYVLQVAVESSPKKTKRILAKLKNLGYPAYSIKVDDPGQLEGSWNRIRIGQFKTVSDARKFGHAVLIPAKFSFWVDLKKNDYKSGTSNSKAFESEDRASQPSGNYDQLQAQTFEPVAPVASSTAPKSSITLSSSLAASSSAKTLPIIAESTVEEAKTAKQAVVKEVKTVKENVTNTEAVKKAADAKQSDWSASEGWE